MKSRAFWLLFSSQTVTVVGDLFGLLALDWLVFQLTQSELAMGTLLFASMLSETIARLLGAPLTDRLHRFRLMALLDFFRFGLFLLPVVLGLFGVLELWHLYVVAVFTGACAGVFNPLSMAALPSLIKGEQLVRGYSLLDSSRLAAAVVTPALAGLSIDLLGPMTGIGINAASFLVSACLLFPLLRHPQGRGEGSGSTTDFNAANTSNASNAWRTYIREAADGFRFFRKAPALLIIMSLVAVKNMGSVAVGGMLIPFSDKILHIDAAQFGLFGSTAGLAMLGGALLVAWLGDIRRRRLVMLGAILVQGIGMIALSQTTTYLTALIVYGIISFSGPFFGTYSSSIYGQMVPEHLRGRVMSTRLLVGGALQPVGAIGGGALAQTAGLPFLFLLSGILPALAALVGFLLPRLKDIDGPLTVIRLDDRKSTASG